ncbi:MAG: DUF1059 domain-containing protein [Candidatus Thorarchaeota archaeon]|nr:DUF1059 domain-containing protein [Candidatus Thorarchaeota archaeon]
MHTFACKDIGMKCGFETSAKSKDALMKNISTHTAKTHNMTSIDSATLAKINNAIKS